MGLKEIETNVKRNLFSIQNLSLILNLESIRRERSQYKSDVLKLTPDTKGQSLQENEGSKRIIFANVPKKNCKCGEYLWQRHMKSSEGVNDKNTMVLCFHTWWDVEDWQTQSSLLAKKAKAYLQISQRRYKIYLFLIFCLIEDYCEWVWRKYYQVYQPVWNYDISHKGEK